MRAFDSGLTVAVLVVLAATASAQEPTWHTDYEQVRRLAKEQGRPILADFTGSDWCFWCKKLKQEVFDTPAFKAWAAERVLLLEVDFPARKEQPAELKAQNERLRATFKVEGYPTVVFLDAQGRELGRSGYKKGGPAPWLEQADALLAKAKASPPAAEEGGQAAEATWLTDYEQARRLAKEQGRLILADFTGSDWCGWCKKLDAEVFATPEFRAWAAAHVVLLQLDYPRGKPQSEALKQQNQALLTRHGVRGFPTILFLDPEGVAVGRLGYQPGGPGPWIEQAQRIVDAKR